MQGQGPSGVWNEAPELWNFLLLRHTPCLRPAALHLTAAR